MVAEHWLVCPTRTAVGLQETLTDVIVGAACTVIVAVPLFVESCLLVAFTVAVVGEDGAV
jgi:hypothetical protein